MDTVAPEQLQRLGADLLPGHGDGHGGGAPHRGDAAHPPQGASPREPTRGGKTAPGGWNTPARPRARGRQGRGLGGSRVSPRAASTRSKSSRVFSGVAISTRKSWSAYSHSTPPWRRRWASACPDRPCRRPEASAAGGRSPPPASQPACSWARRASSRAAVSCQTGGVLLRQIAVAQVQGAQGQIGWAGGAEERQGGLSRFPLRPPGRFWHMCR